MDCLSSEDLKEKNAQFSLRNRLYRIPVLSSWKRPWSRYDGGRFVTWLGFRTLQLARLKGCAVSDSKTALATLVS
jgi:hypothetical protein